MCVRVVAVRGVRASGSGLVAWAGGVCRWQQRPVRGRGIRCKLSRVSLGLQLSVTRQGGPTVLRSGGGVPHGESAARAGYMERQRPAGLHGVSAARRASWGISSPGRQHAASSPQLGRSGWVRARRLSRGPLLRALAVLRCAAGSGAGCCGRSCLLWEVAVCISRPQGMHQDRAATRTITARRQLGHVMKDGRRVSVGFVSVMVMRLSPSLATFPVARCRPLRLRSLPRAGIW